MPNQLYLAASRLLNEVHAQIALTTAGLPTKLREGVVPGSLAWDECECGLLAVEWVGTNYSDTPPTPALQRDEGCRPYVVAGLKVTMARCVPGTQVVGRPPTPAQLDAAAQIQFEDSFAMMRGSTIALTGLVTDNTILGFDMNGAQPQGPEGGCVAVTQSVDVYLSNMFGPC